MPPMTPVIDCVSVTILQETSDGKTESMRIVLTEEQAVLSVVGWTIVDVKNFVNLVSGVVSDCSPACWSR